MKKLSLIFLALLPVCANAATVYDKDGTQMDIFGQVSALALSDGAARAIKTKTNKRNNDNTLQTEFLLGISGRTKINSQISAIALSQWQMPTGANGDESIKARYQYVGFDAQNYGILTFGRGDNAFYTVAGATDIFTQLDMRVNDHYAFGDQMPSLFMYSLSAMGWDFRLSYQTASDEINDTPINIYNGAAFSMATHFKNGMSLAYGLSYYDFNYNNSLAMQNYFAPQMQKMYQDSYQSLLTPSWKIDKGIALSYGDLGEGLYAALVYTNTKYQHFTHHLHSYDAVVNYSFENGISVSAGYGIKRFNSANIQSIGTLGVYYKPISNFKIFTEASFNINSKEESFYSKEQIKDLALDKHKVVLGLEYSY